MDNIPVGSSDAKKALDMNDEMGKKGSHTKEIVTVLGSDDCHKVRKQMKARKGVNEAVNSPGLPVGARKGDIIKFLVKINTQMAKSSVWQCMNDVAWDADKGAWKHNAVYYKLDRKGEPAAINMNNMLGLGVRDVEKLMSEGKIMLMDKNQPLHADETDIKTIRQDLKNLGYEKMVGKSVVKGVTSSGSHFLVSVTDANYKTIYFPIIREILDFLERKGYKHYANDSIREVNGKLTYSGYNLVVDKIKQ